MPSTGLGRVQSPAAGFCLVSVAFSLQDIGIILPPNRPRFLSGVGFWRGGDHGERITSRGLGTALGARQRLPRARAPGMPCDLAIRIRLQVPQVLINYDPLPGIGRSSVWSASLKRSAPAPGPELPTRSGATRPGLSGGQPGSVDRVATDRQGISPQPIPSMTVRGATLLLSRYPSKRVPLPPLRVHDDRSNTVPGWLQTIPFLAGSHCFEQLISSIVTSPASQQRDVRVTPLS
jgi:hypothetical protein